MPIEVAGAKFPDAENHENICFCCVCLLLFFSFPAVGHTFPSFLIALIIMSFQSLFTLSFLTWLCYVLQLTKLVGIMLQVEINRS